MKTTKQAIDAHASWKPPHFEDSDAAAIQAIAKGQASADQQKRALTWIIEKAAGTYDMSFRPGPDSRDTDFAEGRRFVGLQVVKLIHIKIGLLRREE